MDANTTLASAIANGYDQLSPRDVLLCILYGAANASGGNGGLAGTGDPTASAAAGTTYIDTATGKFWENVSSPSPGTTWLKLIG